MCGRYYINEETEKDIRRIVAEIDKKINWERRGDIHPSDAAPVITGKIPGLFAEEMHWGFPSYRSKQLMINARSETALEKRSFSESVCRRRCVIPAHHFYEWDRRKNKITFTWDESPTLYLAGFYNYFEDGNRFIILTTAAHRSMQPVHDRMPLILPEQQASKFSWLRQRAIYMEEVLLLKCVES